MGITFNSSTVYKGTTSQGSYLSQSGVGAYYQVGISGGTYTVEMSLKNSRYMKDLTFSFKKIYASASNINFKIEAFNSSGTSLGSTTFVSGSTSSTSVNSGNAVKITFSNYIAPQTFTVKISMTSSSGAMTFYAPQNTSSPMTFSTVDYTKITFDLAGGTGGPTSPWYVKTSVSSTVSSTKPTKANSTSTSNFTITGNKNGGNANKTATATKTVTTKYTFTNWTTKTGTAINAGASTTFTTADNTLTANYSSSNSTTYSNNTLAALADPTRSNSTSDGYTVTFNANGGGTAPSAQTAENTTTYAFKGWGETSTSTTALASTKSYTSAATVYAIWTPTTTNGSITLPSMTRNGYTFLGWATSSAATSGTTGSYTPTANTTLYAIWKADGGVVIFDANGNPQTAIPYVYTNNEWKAAIPYVYHNDEWKISTGG